MLNNNGLEKVDESQVGKSPEQSLNRACEYCRSLKVRCIVDNEKSSQQCQRCFRAKRSCVFAPPQKRRQRKRTDARVAELEREVRAMRSLLKEGKATLPGAPRHQEQASNSPESTTEAGRKASTPATTESSSEGGFHPSDRSSPPATVSWDINDGADLAFSMARSDLARKETNALDVIDRRILSMDTADRLLTSYKLDLVNYHPGLIILPETTTAEVLRREKPVLFVAILAAAALGEDGQLAWVLHGEITRIIADRVIVSGIKSLELVHALIVNVTYSYPPDSLAKLQHYQYCHLATTMALDLGIASKPRKGGWGFDLPVKHNTQHVTDDGSQEEKSRTILSCYLVSASLAMMMRRPIQLSFNKWMQICLDELDKSSVPQDKALANMVKLQRIGDETSASLGFDDPSTDIDLPDSVLQVTIRGFERRMEDWRKSVGTYFNENVPLSVQYYILKINMYEFAMDGGQHDAQEFKQKHLALPSLDDASIKGSHHEPFNNSQVNATIKCADSLHAILDIILAMDEAKLTKVPNFYFARALRSLLSLLNIFFFAATTNLGEMIEPHFLDQGRYITSMIHILEKATGPMNRRVPSHWLTIIRKLDDWHNKSQGLFDKPWGKGNQTSQALPPTSQRDQLVWDNAAPQSVGQSEGVGGGNLSSNLPWPAGYDTFQAGVVPQGQNSDIALPDLALMDMTDFQTDWAQDNLSNPNAGFNNWMFDYNINTSW